MRADATEILVRGAGPVGCVAALLLHHAGRRVALLASGVPAAAFRPIVLSYASRLILERVGVWQGLPDSAIETIHVSQTGRFGRTVFSAADAGVPALGYVMEYAVLLHALRGAVQELIAHEAPAAACVVHAEGAAAQAEETRYTQDALVARVRFAPRAGSTAYERFTDEGPLALLPLDDSYALVWSMRPERALQLVSASEKEFLQQLETAAGAVPGRPLAAEARAVQPLALRVALARTGERSVYIGNAAQTLHPVAGQGLNLGLRDAWDLAQIVRDAPDPGDAATLARFSAARRLDAQAAIRITHLLATTFLKKNPFLGLALTALDIFPAPRRFFARRMIFGASALP